MDNKSENEYSPFLKLLHWIMGILIICALCVGFMLDDLPPSIRSTAFMVHKSIGMTILFLFFARLIVRYKTHIPKPVGTPFMKNISKITVLFLYFSIFTMTFSGYLMSSFANYPIRFFNVFTFPNIMAENTALANIFRFIHINWALPFAGLIVLHILATLFHTFILKDKILERILPQFKKK